MTRCKLYLLGILCLFTTVAFCQTDCTTIDKGKDYSGKDFSNCNFTTLTKGSLIGANFSNATLNGAQFQNMDLSNADFTGAKMLPSTKGITDISGCILTNTIFKGAIMDSINLQFAIFQSTDFSGASLFYSDFGPVMKINPGANGVRTSFKNTTTDFDHFPINNWSQSDWSNTDLTRTKISGLNNKNFSFEGKNISNALVAYSEFTNFNFKNCIMTGANFNNSILSYSNFNGAQMDQVDLTDAQLNNVQMRSSILYSEKNSGKGAVLSGVVFSGSNLSGSDFTYANLQGSNMQGITADSCTFNNANFESSSNYNVANLNGSSLNYSSFNSASLNGVNFSNAYIVKGQFNDLALQGTIFAGANMPFANFQNATLEGVLFTGSILQGAIFKSTTLKAPPTGGSGVDFSCSQLGGADFSNATVTQCSFSDAVMPVAGICCQNLDGAYCGVIGINHLSYGGTILPSLKAKVTCPNGDLAICDSIQWQIPGWKTSNCNSNHNLETVWFKPNCNGQDTTGRITFADPNLQNCIIDQVFGGDETHVITKSEVATVTSLSCPARQISDLTGLQYFTSLEELDLSYNQLIDGTFYNQLHNLQTLKISGNNIKILNLQGDSNINYLNASNNQLTSVLLDANMYLNFIDLSYNDLTDMSTIAIQTSLTYLDISHNKLTKIGDLSNMSEISTIYLENNSLTTIGNLSKIYDNGSGNLEYLLLSCNLPFDCSSLGLNSTTAEKNFLSHSNCGDNSGTGCN